MVHQGDVGYTPKVDFCWKDSKNQGFEAQWDQIFLDMAGSNILVASPPARMHVAKKGLGLGFPTKNIIVLVVTIASWVWGVDTTNIIILCAAELNPWSFLSSSIFASSWQAVSRKMTSHATSFQYQQTLYWL